MCLRTLILISLMNTKVNLFPISSLIKYERLGMLYAVIHLRSRCVPERA